MGVEPFIFFWRCDESVKFGGDVMLIPGRAGDGETQTEGELLAVVYDELRQVASRLMRRERSDHTLSPTAVVHEAVLRLMGDVNFAALDRNFLQAAAARAMREVLIDHARRRAADRRGGDGGGCPSTPSLTTSNHRISTSWRSTRRSTSWPWLMNV